MRSRSRLTRTAAGTLVLLVVASLGGRPAGATPPEGVTFQVIGRATIPAFDARRLYFQEANEAKETKQGPHLFRHWKRKIWKIDLEATRMIDVVTVIFTVEPGGHGGWHTHPGPAFFTVSKGTLTMYDADDPSCTPQPFPAGTGSLEADTSRHHHTLRNETSEPVETVVTFLVPVGAPIRTDLPDPGTCPF